MKVFEKTVTELLRHGVAVRFCATGDSMHPSIRSGEHVHVAPADARALRVGDIVLARATRGLTAHRVVKVASQSIITRGDNALLGDAALRYEDVLGRVTFVERDGAPVPVPSAPARIRIAARRAVQLVLSL
jgi:signal peptidase I